MQEHNGRWKKRLRAHFVSRQTHVIAMDERIEGTALASLLGRWLREGQDGEPGEDGLHLEYDTLGIGQAMEAEWL